MFARHSPAVRTLSWWEVPSPRHTKRPAVDTIGEWPRHTPIYREAPASRWAPPARWNKSCLARQKLTMAAKIWLVQLLPAWATLALEILPNFSKRRSLSRLLSRPKENSFKQFKALE